MALDDDKFKYDVFISYSRKDIEFVRRFQRVLANYAPSAGLPLPQRRLRVFRDESDFQGTEYESAVEQNLKSAATLLVICSPQSRASVYVGEEIRTFIALRDKAHVVSLLLAGSPNNQPDVPESEHAFHDELVSQLPIPLAADYRGCQSRDRLERDRFESAWYKVLSDIYADYGVDRNQIEQREKLRQRRSRRLRTAVVGVAAVVLSALTIWALVSRREAILQRDIARSRELSARAMLTLSTNPELSVLLSREAFQVAATGEAETALRTAMGAFTAAWTLPNQEAAALSLDRTRVIARSRDGTLRVLEANSGRVLRAFSGARRYVVSPTGDRIVSLTAGSAPLVLDVATGAELFRCGDRDSATVWTATFNAKGDTLLVADKEGIFRSWDVRSGKVTSTTPAFPGTLSPDDVVSPGLRWLITFDHHQLTGIWSIGDWQRKRIAVSGVSDTVPSPFAFASNPSFTEDERSMVIHSGGSETAMTDIPASAWAIDLATGKATLLNGGHSSYIKWSAFSKDGRFIITTSEDETACVWDAKSGKRLHTLTGHEGWVLAGSFSDDDTRVVTFGRDLTARVWDVDTGRELSRVGTYGFKTAVLTPRGANLLTVDDAGRARFWEINPADAVKFDRQTGAISDVSFADHDRVALTIGLAGPSTWDTSTGQLIRRFPRGDVWTYRLAMAPDSRHFMVSGDANDAFVYDLYDSSDQGITWLTGTPVGDPTERVPMVSVGFAPDGRAAVGSNEKGTSFLWDLTSQTVRATLAGFAAGPSSFSGDGTGLVTSSTGTDGTASVWDVESGKLSHRLTGHKGPVSSAVFARKGPLILTTGADGTARVWHYKTGEMQAVLQHRDKVVRGEFSLSGDMILTMTDKGEVTVWSNRHAWIAVQTIAVDPSEAKRDNFVLSPDGRWLVTWSAYRTGSVGSVFIWEVASGRQLTRIAAHSDGIAAVVFSQDSRSILSGSYDGTAEIYRCRLCRSPEELLRDAESRGVREWADGERLSYVR
jgi:WD40 repeat protein